MNRQDAKTPNYPRITSHAVSVTHYQSRVTSHPLAAAVLLLLTAVSPVSAGEPEWKLLQDQAIAHLQRGSFDRAEQFGRAALKEAESSLGPDHRATEQSLSTLSAALRLRGKPGDALPLVQRLVIIRTKLHGPEAPSTALALHNNAEILMAQDRFTEAELLQARALAVFEKKLGAKHVNTAIALHNMGAIMLKQGKFKEAEKYLRGALAAKEDALTPGNLSIAHTLENLSTALDAQGRQIEAEKLKRRAEAIRRKATS
jgi:tetratricopeptide (TPR) repeat protein